MLARVVTRILEREEELRIWRQENVKRPPAPRAAAWCARSAAASSRRPQASARTAAERMALRAPHERQPSPRPGAGEHVRRVRVARRLWASLARLRAAGKALRPGLVA